LPSAQCLSRQLGNVSVNRRLPGRNLGYTSGPRPHSPSTTATHRQVARRGGSLPRPTAAAGFPKGARLPFRMRLWKPFRKLPGMVQARRLRDPIIRNGRSGGTSSKPYPPVGGLDGGAPGPLAAEAGHQHLGTEPDEPPPGLDIRAGQSPGAGEHPGPQRFDFYRITNVGQHIRTSRGVTIGIHQVLPRPGSDLGDHHRFGSAPTISRITLRLHNPTVDEECRRTPKAHSGRRCSGFNKAAQCPW
jgi:hypothetical protein